MIKFNASKQITFNKQHRLGSHEEQSLLFSLVHLILCWPREGNRYDKADLTRWHYESF